MMNIKTFLVLAFLTVFAVSASAQHQIKSPVEVDGEPTNLANLGIEQERSFLEGTVTDGDYELINYQCYSGQIVAVITEATSGTATATVKIEGTALGGTANAVSSSQVVETHSTDNAMVEGDKVIVTISGASSPVNIRITLKISRS